ncbi:MAG TPA: hypothetical protein VMX74_09215 [Pirellulales bacterium]|nr:hypothetical protein [Pirellulales bacterium]
MYGGEAYGEVTVGGTLTDIGTPIIPEVTLTTTTLVFVVEIDALVSPEE